MESVQRGVRWLKQHADNLTETRDLAITVSALVAAERNPHSNLVQRLTSSIIQQQTINGSWNDELWDTTWAARALSDVGHGINSSSLRTAYRFLEATQDTISGTWYEEPFETMLVLDLVITICPERLSAFSERPLQWVASLQNSEGCIIGIRYTGMAASLFCKMQKFGFATAGRAMKQAIGYIGRDLDGKTIWTGAAWSNYYPLKALLDSGLSLDDPKVAKAVEWFLESQDGDGKWSQVSAIHDTAMAVMVMSALLTTPLVDISVPRTAVLNASRENGTMRVSFHGPDAGAIAPAEKLKISNQVREELSHNQQLLVTALGLARSKGRSGTRVRRSTPTKTPLSEELERAGRYAYGHLVPARIQLLLESSPADHLRLDIDERLIDLPWELIHDGREFLCLRYAVGRLLMSDQGFQPPHRHPSSAQNARVLIVADPTGDLPAAAKEGKELAKLLRDRCKMNVDEHTTVKISKKDFLLSLRDYAIVHFAGHASHRASSPDESCLHFVDGEIQAFEIARFIAGRSPSVVFLNACWSAEELRDPHSFSPMMRGLGRTFLYAGVTAFLGYLVPIPDESATQFAISFYESLAQGQTIGESLRLARIQCRHANHPNDLTWSSAVLYGDPTARAIDVSLPN